MLAMIMLTALASAQDPDAGRVAEPARATLESCQFENDRWVCRYQMPDIAIVPNGPAVDVEGGPVNAARPAPSPLLLEAEVLSTEEQDLVLRCAEASWLSLCTPAQRRTARALKAEADADTALRQTIGTRIGAGDCAGAERAALEAGRLSLAAQARRYCDGAP